MLMKGMTRLVMPLSEKVERKKLLNVILNDMNDTQTVKNSCEWECKESHQVKP